MSASQEILKYLWETSHGDNPSITVATADWAATAWLSVWLATSDRMPVPMTAVELEAVYYSWDRYPHCLAMHIIPNESIHFFYWNRETGESLSEDHVIGSPIPAGIVAKFELFY